MSLIRWTRRDREKELRVPAELREEQTRGSAEAFPVWVVPLIAEASTVVAQNVPTLFGPDGRVGELFECGAVGAVARETRS